MTHLTCHLQSALEIDLNHNSEERYGFGRQYFIHTVNLKSNIKLTSEKPVFYFKYIFPERQKTTYNLRNIHFLNSKNTLRISWVRHNFTKGRSITFGHMPKPHPLDRTRGFYRRGFKALFAVYRSKLTLTKVTLVFYTMTLNTRISGLKTPEFSWAEAAKMCHSLRGTFPALRSREEVEEVVSHSFRFTYGTVVYLAKYNEVKGNKISVFVFSHSHHFQCLDVWFI